MAVTVTVDSREVQATLNRLQKAVGNLQPAMQGIGQAMRSAIQQNLGQGVTPWGEPMQPLKHRQGVPLNDTRQHIYNKITYAATATSVAVGLLDSQAAKVGQVHQFGAVIKPVKAKRLVFRPKGSNKTFFAKQVTIPARPFMPIRDGRADLPPEWERKVVDEIERHLAKP